MTVEVWVNCYEGRSGRAIQAYDEATLL